MSRPNIVKVVDLDLSTLRYSKLSTPKDGKGSCVYVNHLEYDGGKPVERPLFIEFPVMMTWGAQKNEKKDPGTTFDKYDLSLQFPNNETDNTPEVQALLHKMLDLEQHIINDCAANSEKWFKKKRSVETVSAGFGTDMTGSILKYPMIDKVNNRFADRSRTPSLKFKLGNYDNKFQFSLFDENLRQIYNPTTSDMSIDEVMTLLPKFSKLKVIAQFALWFSGTNIYPVFTMKSAVCQKASMVSLDYGACMFEPLSADEQLNMSQVSKEAAAIANEASSSGGGGGIEVVDSEEEEEEEDEMPIVQPRKPAAVAPANKPPPAPVVVAAVEEDEEEAAPVITKPKTKVTKAKK